MNLSIAYHTAAQFHDAAQTAVQRRGSMWWNGQLITHFFYKRIKVKEYFTLIFPPVIQFLCLVYFNF